MLARTAGGKLVDHAAPGARVRRALSLLQDLRLQIAASIRPDIRLMRRPRARREQLHWCFIGMDHGLRFEI
jgi:hypothetical protein